MQRQLNRALALLLVMALSLCLLPTAALAETGEDFGTITPVGRGEEGGTILPTDGEPIDEAPTEDVPVGTEIPYDAWKQSDPQWRDLLIGSRTMGEVGCAVTAIAMLIVQAGLRDETAFDPGLFLQEMKAVGGFRGNEVYWGKAGEAVEGFHYAGSIELRGTEQEKTATIFRCDQLGYHIVVAVKSYGHYVAVRNATADTVTMMDPGSGSTDLFSRYSADGVVRIHLYSLQDDPVLPEVLEAFVSLIVGERASAFRGAEGLAHGELLSYYPN